GTPTHLRLLLESEDNQFNIPRMKHFIIGGEALPPETVTRFFNRSTGKAPYISNVYGPTECCVDSTQFLLSKDNIHTLSQQESIPIGGPMPNERIYILDKHHRLLPAGVPGELCISGDGVACGYLNRPQLTAEKFVPNPLAPGETLYKTGDLARWLPDGNIEFLGRMDFQVKIRGFRIEPGEIENRLLRHQQVRSAVVAVKTDNNNDGYLCAYFVGETENMTTQLKAFLLEQLPDYMIPAAWVQMESIPVTANGKVDRKALPEPGTFSGDYAPPETQTQLKMTAIWAGILGREEETMGIDADFFEIGGHSPKATLLTARIHKELDVKVPLVEIFENPTIRGISRYIEKTGKEEFLSIKPVEKKEYYPLSTAQKRMYILQQMNPQSTAYNMPEIIPLNGEPDREELENCINKLIRRHESFRTSFHVHREEPVQRVHDYEASVPFRLEERSNDVSSAVSFLSESTGEIPDDFIRPFKLSRAPLLRVGLLLAAGERYLLLVDKHHIITDGISSNVLKADFTALYLEGEKELPPLRIQYKDFSIWQNSRKQQEQIKKQEDYWLRQLGGELPVLEIPTDYPRPRIQSFEGADLFFALSHNEALALRQVALKVDATIYMTVIAIYTILLSKLSGQEDIIVGTPIAARRHADLQNIIGMFVNTLAMRNYPGGAKTFPDFLEEVKERSLEAFENQDYPFEDLVDKLVVNRDISRNPLFDVMLAVENISEKSESADSETTHKDDLEHDYKYKKISSKFDMALTCQEEGEDLRFSLIYCTIFTYELRDTLQC
ncbi:MAG: AMP-binding protein, partial [bacterium]|nr:AMP-binding protein [bacterium]